VATQANAFTLAHWRRSVAELYADVRAASDRDPAVAATRFRAARDALFRDHPQSPIAPGLRRGWPGAAWHPYDPAWRIVATVEAVASQPAASPPALEIALADDGVLRCTRAGLLRFTADGRAATLTAYWLAGYGGGLWLPFTDASSGRGTYGGGRYLYDTIKGADLGAGADVCLLDFNYAYNPSCAYDPRWSCPLSPPENALPFAVTAGEKMQ
jgi:uncharacterized protein